jgi:hypothetical protein
MEVENKWWHRLVRVLIFGSTIVVAIFAITFFISNSEIWKQYSYPAFSFEDNYSTTKGKEVNCFIDFKPTGVTCGEYAGGKGPYEAKYAVDLSDFTKRYNKAIKDEVGQNTTDKICADGKAFQSERDKLGIEGLDPKMLSCMRITVDIAPIQIEDFPSKLNYQRLTYDEYLTDKQIGFIRSLWLGIKAKMTTSIIYPIFLTNLLYVILAIIGWFIFWESIVYRTLLYILYGKNDRLRSQKDN